MKRISLLKLAGVVCMFCAAMTTFSPAQTLTTLHNFAGPEGATPDAPLVLGSDGNLYGTTIYGGAHGAGAAFKITPSGTLTRVYSFCSVSGAYGCYDGNAPLGMVQGRDGNFYGVTIQGGELCCGETAMGTIFKLTPGGILTTLYNFCFQANCVDGQSPTSIMQASDGNLYGVDSLGGYNGLGDFYQLTLSGNFTDLFDFDFTNGKDPTVPLVQGNDGNLYGTAPYGGVQGYGTVFRMTLSGSPTLLYSFCSQPNCTDGAYPTAGLAKGSDGNFYGTTSQGGANYYGEIFKITPSGTLTVLHSFVRADGINVVAPLVEGRDGNFYGTASAGGANNDGTVFQVTPSGAFTNLHNFSGTDGASPNGGVLQAANGNFYGTTYSGGANNDGTVFEIEVNLSTLTVSISGAGTVTSTDGFINCPGTCSHAYPTNTPVTLNASAAGGWSFAGWSGACTGTGSCNLTMTQNQSVTANFTQYSYHLTVSTSGSGSVTSTDGYINCPGTCSHTYLSNTQVTLNANPALGWSLSSWGGACSGNGSCHITMTQNESVTATFTQDYYTLTVAIFGDGSVTSTDGYIDCPGTCSHTYLSLTHVTLNAAPAEGWVFGGWNGGCAGTGSCSLLMTQTLTVDAIFSQALRFVATAPCRLVDTRNPNGTFGGPPIQGGTSRSFPIPQQTHCDIPTTAAAYSLNVTLVPPPGGTVGFLTIWPTGEDRPNVSIMNSWDGRFKANAAIVPAGTNGAVSVYASNTTNVVLDIDGYFESVSGSTLAFYPLVIGGKLAPCRVADTRNPDGPLGGPFLAANQERDFPVLDASSCNIPSSAAAYSLNFTVVPRNDQVWVFTAWPFGDTLPGTSTLNAPTGTVVANAAIVPAGTSGKVATLASADTDLVIDINGYFAAAGEGGLSLYPMAPCRTLDTRAGNAPPFTGMLSPPVNVVGSVCGPPSSAEAYVFNATLLPAGDPVYFLTLWPDGGAQPNASTLNAYDGAVTSNMAIVPTTNGSIDAYAAGLTQLILDISGYFAP